jgi:hypothetical protein
LSACEELRQRLEAIEQSGSAVVFPLMISLSQVSGSEE